MRTPNIGGMYKTKVRYWTHGLIIAAVGWSLFSGFMVFDFFDEHRSFGWDLLPHFIVWAIHAAIIAVATYLYFVEKNQPIVVIEPKSKADWLIEALGIMPYLTF